MKYYHATNFDNASSIIQDKEIRTGCDGIVYLADSVDNALKFVCLRAFAETIIVFEIDIPKDENKFVEETFDHNYKFFKCKSYGYPKNISTSWVTTVLQSQPK